MYKMTSTLLLLAMAATAQAKLPALSEEAKAAAAAAKEKTAWSDKVAAYQLCLSQDKVAGYYFKHKPDAPKPSAAIPACTNPGPYVAQVVAAKEVGVADSKPVPAAGKPDPGAAPKK